MKCEELADKIIAEMQEHNLTPEQMIATIRLARVKFYKMKGREVVDVYEASSHIHKFIDAIHPSLNDLREYTALKAKAMNYISNYTKNETIHSTK